jgi:hypothetical protein
MLTSTQSKEGALMNTIDRGFLYVGVLAVVAGVAIYVMNIAKVSFTPYLAAPTKEIFVGTMDSSQCYISDTYAMMNSFPSPDLPHTIKWTAIGDNHSYTITFPKGTPLQRSVVSVSVPAGQSSKVLYIAPANNADFPYTVQNNANSCKEPIPEPAWVHVSK